jgi:hypothetical protein
MDNPEKAKDVNFILNDNLLVVMIDALRLSTRSDGLNYIQLGVTTPEGIKEQFRMMVPKANLEKIISVLCNGSGYYPAKETDETKIEKKEKRQEKK